MSKESSVAPTERVNIVYKPATGNAQEQVELPLKVLMLGDFTGQEDARPLEQRAPINVDKANFNEVMAQQNLKVTLTAADKLSADPNATMNVSLQFKNLNDFSPESVVNQVPELKKLLELRSALNALKGPLGNLPAFRKKLQALLADEDGRKALIKELGLTEETK
ncbi:MULTISPECIES: type VI secretion system contractile sheath small subunit [Myxococcus]|uniref:Type VI secretion system-associated protein n=3 Tax=Myxococcus TaxID=32 RepID=Q1D305_MYXXD|nr:MULTISPECIES: type VI secretion system contractile sheath small subunit [Myxococcus]5URW_1A Chain 1A, TssB [Myxococcus xanthus DK 1622]5URW_1C Chain 1C, TssB [Myxococcus xanthus DK 1622]5URW_1E Chain 1E, TssB [Myxococcus xanthus DK 1622]5URW_1G Chain 1G, TssB [Myxococcus xanthus DK 1622]5URW_1I Chain 1I, TssB [Myxococcus xanthus DK 1622]5URW_1K Chain 1K, TssB [Myxococcus xanthus DK 1622]5URW_2A Chain 2A, TssB [Myxococcus xanthus DK 1622]5URW_2C Chain 2C, TssB [Myxococcus xanthus DK 1622]